MKRVFSIFLVLMFSTAVVLSQEKKQSMPVVLQIATPIYPIPAIHLGLEEKILAQVKIDRTGKITSVSFDRGAKVFHTVIEDAINQWQFDKSPEKLRQAEINFVFTLLPFDSKSYTSTVFHLPNIVEVFAKRVKVIDTTDTKTQ